MSVLDFSSPEMIERQLRRSAKDPGEGVAAEEFSYRAPNGRVFEVRLLDSGDYFMSEMQPNGRYIREWRNGAPDIRHEPKLEDLAEGDPNDFERAAEEAGFDPDEIIRMGGGLGVASITYPSLREVAEAIVSALDRNDWYVHVDHEKLADPEFQEAQRAISEEEGRKYRAEMREIESASREEHGLFEGLYAAMGPLPDGTKQAILAFLNAPTEENWDEVSGKCVKGIETVWQLWARADPDAPVSKPLDGPWPVVPDPETIRGVLRDAGARDKYPREEEPDAPGPRM